MVGNKKIKPEDVPDTQGADETKVQEFKIRMDQASKSMSQNQDMEFKRLISEHTDEVLKNSSPSNTKPLEDFIKLMSEYPSAIFNSSGAGTSVAFNESIQKIVKAYSSSDSDKIKLMGILNNSHDESVDTFNGMLRRELTIDTGGFLFWGNKDEVLRITETISGKNMDDLEILCGFIKNNRSDCNAARNQLFEKLNNWNSDGKYDKLIAELK